MGLFQAFQSHGGEVGIWPFLMIASRSSPSSVRPLSQDAAQSASDVAVHGFKRRDLAVFEVLKPSARRSVEVRADPLHAASLASAGLLANRVFEPIHALLARPFHAPLEVVAKELKASGLARIHDPGLLRVEL